MRSTRTPIRPLSRMLAPLVLALLLLLAFLLFVLPVPARALPGRSLSGAVQPLSSPVPLNSPLQLSSHAGPGQYDPVPASSAISAQLRSSTGLAPSQVTVANACGTPQPGHAQCDAQAVVLRSTHQPAHPHVKAVKTFTQVFPRVHGSIGPAPAAAGAVAGAVASGPPQPNTPAWLQQAYDLTYLSQHGGAGDTIGIVDVGDDPTAESDLATYRSQFGLSPCTTANGCFAKVTQTGQQANYPPAQGWQGEESLDLDAVSALCPNCKIVLVEVNSNSLSDLDAGIVEAVALGANQVSNSWSGASTTPIPGTYSFPGVSIIASTGDHGYVPAYDGPGMDGYPAALPGVTAAGGTNLAPTTTGSPSARGFTDAAWSAADFNGSPEGAGSGCDTQESKPAWQTDAGCSGRSYADVSADADPYTGLEIYYSGGGGWLLYGGTSLASPLIAAFEAVTGISGTSPAWAYTDSAMLSDPDDQRQRLWTDRRQRLSSKHSLHL